MSNILKEMGLDAQDVKWYHLSACSGTTINWFYDDYESDKDLANQVDSMCLHCPVIKQCYREGVNNKEKGTWGGIFLDLGRVDKNANSHKTDEKWKKLKKIHGKSSIY